MKQNIIQTYKLQRRNYLMLYSLFNSLVNVKRENKQFFLTDNNMNDKTNNINNITNMNNNQSTQLQLPELSPDIVKNKQSFFKLLSTIINTNFAIILNDYERILIEKIQENMLNKEINQFLNTFEYFKYTSNDTNILNNSNIHLVNTNKKYILNKKLVTKESVVWFDSIIKKVNK